MIFTEVGNGLLGPSSQNGPSLGDVIGNVETYGAREQANRISHRTFHSERICRFLQEPRNDPRPP